MTKITFHGGVNDIGGNKFLVEDRNTRVLMDFGMSFSEEGRYFSQFLQARTSNYLNDMIDLGILPNLKGLYRRDFARHMGLDGEEETAFNGVLLTHAHVDHCAYIQYLREDITIYCSEESKLIMQNFDETGSDQYLTMKEKFRMAPNKTGGTSRARGESTEVPRQIETFRPGKEFAIDSIRVEPHPVDHSIPGVHAFILHTSGGTIGNTADLRFHGRRKDETEKFVQRCGESDLDVLLCEGTRVNSTSSPTEHDVERNIEQVIGNTAGLVICGYPIRDLDRLLSFYNAAKTSGRDLVIDLKQAYLLKLFDGSEALRGNYPSPTDKNIRIFLPRGSWGVLDKDREKFPFKQLEEDYKRWAREFLTYDNLVDYRDVRRDEKESVFYCNDFKLQELIDIQPSRDSVYIRSLTEPFNDEMEISTERIKNWFVHFGLVKKEEDWIHFHVSGHGDGDQIKRVIDGSRPKSLVPIHTQNPQYHRKWHPNVTMVEQHGTVDVRA